MICCCVLYCRVTICHLLATAHSPQRPSVQNKQKFGQTATCERERWQNGYVMDSRSSGIDRLDKEGRKEHERWAKDVSRFWSLSHWPNRSRADHHEFTSFYFVSLPRETQWKNEFQSHSALFKMDRYLFHFCRKIKNNLNQKWEQVGVKKASRNKRKV